MSTSSTPATPRVESTTTTPIETTPTLPAPTTTVPATELDTGDVSGFETTVIGIGGETLTVAVADSPGLRARGLMQVADLGDLDGMLFTWGGETVESGFFMKNTIIPLRIAFFAPDGSLVDSFVMEPCGAQDPCPRYRADGPYAYAVELPSDRTVAPGTRLVLQP